MGLDLKLLPVDGDHAPGVFYAHQMLNLHRNAIIGAIESIAEEHAVDIPMPLSCFLGRSEDGEYKYGDETEDPYGTALQYVLAKHLKPLAKLVGLEYDAEHPTKRGTAWDRVAGDTLKSRPSKRVAKLKLTQTNDDYRSPLNRAAIAYICALPDDFKIVLYWN